VSTWQPVTHSDQKPDADPRSQPLAFNPSPADREAATRAQLELEQNRRRLNLLDGARRKR